MQENKELSERNEEYFISKLVSLTEELVSTTNELVNIRSIDIHNENDTYQKTDKDV